MVMFDKELAELNASWKYKYDEDQYASREYWKIMKQAPYIGDCEDYALTLLWLISGKSMLKFWLNLITFKAQIRRVITKNGGGHAILRYGNMYADNWTLKFVEWEEIEKLGHKPFFWLYTPLDVALKLGIAKIMDLKNGRGN
jgi:predicted transglutaminase-like cysteine proteinase